MNQTVIEVNQPSKVNSIRTKFLVKAYDDLRQAKASCPTTINSKTLKDAEKQYQADVVHLEKETFISDLRRGLNAICVMKKGTTNEPKSDISSTHLSPVEVVESQVKRNVPVLNKSYDEDIALNKVLKSEIFLVKPNLNKNANINESEYIQRVRGMEAASSSFTYLQNLVKNLKGKCVKQKLYQFTQKEDFEICSTSPSVACRDENSSKSFSKYLAPSHSSINTKVNSSRNEKRHKTVSVQNIDYDKLKDLITSNKQEGKLELKFKERGNRKQDKNNLIVPNLPSMYLNEPEIRCNDLKHNACKQFNITIPSSKDRRPNNKANTYQGGQKLIKIPILVIDKEDVVNKASHDDGFMIKLEQCRKDIEPERLAKTISKDIDMFRY